MLVSNKFLLGPLTRRIKNNPQLQEILGNSGWLMADSLVRRGMGLLVTALLAGYLGPSLYGEYSYALAIVMIVTPLGQLSLDAITVKNVINLPSKNAEILGTSFSLMLVGGVVAFILAISAAFYLRPDDHLIHLLVAILSFSTIFQAFTAIEFFFLSQLQSKLNFLATTSAFFLSNMAKVILIFFNASIVAFAWAGLAETILAALGLLIVYNLKGFSIRAWTFSKRMGASFLKTGWPLVLATLLTVVYLRIDQIMLGNMGGSEELGNYSLAVRFSEAWNFIPMAISGSVFPAILEANKFSEELFYSRLQRLYALIAFLSYMFAIPMTFFSDNLISSLFGPDFEKAGSILPILVWTIFFTGMSSARYLLVVAKNWTRINLASIGLGCAINIILNFLLIPDYGAKGAVFATLVSYWLAIHGSCFIFKPLRKNGILMTRAIIYPKFW